MGDYIERKAASDAACAALTLIPPAARDALKAAIDKVPPAYVRPAVRGRWSWRTGSEYRCTNCGRHAHVDEVMEEPAYNYCPNCGADMRGGSEQ